MEDILASIRRILSEEETQEQAAPAPAAAPAAPAAPAAAGKAQEWGAGGAKSEGPGGQAKEWNDKAIEAPGAKAKEWNDKPVEAPGAKKESWQDKPADAGAGAQEGWAQKIPEAPGGKQESWQDKPVDAPGGKQESWHDKPPAAAAGPTKAWDQEEARRAPAAEEDDGVLVLTPDMIAEDDLELAEGGGGMGALAELKRQVARRAQSMAGDRNLALGNGSITIEQLVREILDDLLRDWLNQHLPPMVDKIARREIQRLVNQDFN